MAIACAGNEVMDASAYSLTRRLKEQAQALGFDLAGVVAATPARRLAAYERWLAQAYHGAMAYMARPDRVRRRQDLQVILPSAQALVCVGLSYAAFGPPDGVLREPGRGRISNYAWGADYHAVMTPRLEALADWLAWATNGATRSRVYVDTGAILERDHAESAEFGFIGKNTMLIHPHRGSFFFLGEIITSAPLIPDPPRGRLPACGRCRRCLDACPTGAFPTPYVLDARRCISYLTIELKGIIPPDLRPLLGNWIYGCDICQDVCPFNRFTRPSAEVAFQPASLDAAAPPLDDILGLDEITFAARYSRSPIGRLGRARLVRNACVAAGNWGDPVAEPALTRLLNDADSLVRGHAAWALGRNAAPTARDALIAALESEIDPAVRQEIQQALAGQILPM